MAEVHIAKGMEELDAVLGAWDRLAARALDPRVLDRAFAGLDDSTFAGPLSGDEFFRQSLSPVFQL